MRFAIDNGMPYLVSHGRAYPVEIKNGNVRYDKDQSFPSDIPGEYSLREVVAKCGKSVSSIKKKSHKKQEADSGVHGL